MIRGRCAALSEGRLKPNRQFGAPRLRLVSDRLLGRLILEAEKRESNRGELSFLGTDIGIYTRFYRMFLTRYRRTLWWCGGRWALRGDPRSGKGISYGEIESQSVFSVRRCSLRMYEFGCILVHFSVADELELFERNGRPDLRDRGHIIVLGRV
jgi:hypothetical protein